MYKDELFTNVVTYCGANKFLDRTWQPPFVYHKTEYTKQTWLRSGSPQKQFQQLVQGISI